METVFNRRSCIFYVGFKAKIWPIPGLLILLSKYGISLFILCFLLSYQSAISQGLIDKDASFLTKNLYKNIKDLRKKGIMFGQEDGLYSGVYWKGNHDRSDVKDLIGCHPAIVGWDLGKIETGAKINFDHVPFDSIVVNSRRFFSTGGINTFSWHCNNPLNLKLSVREQEIGNTIEQLFSNPESLEKFNACLDSVCRFLNQIRNDRGELIPVIFRPFHENTGNYFWWGNKICTPDQYIKLWRYTVHYLRDIKGLHHIIYAYSTSYFISAADYLERYPGDDFVDILGFDSYDNDQNHKDSIDVFKAKILSMITIMASIGRTKGKPYAITETGYKLMPREDWWTQTLYPAILNSGLSYVLIWINAGPSLFWGTYTGQTSAADFIKFSKYKNIYFHSEIQKINMYK
jgi:mannan endo-1,4-beta-mannosidase